MAEALDNGQPQRDDFSTIDSPDDFELVSDASMVGTKDFSIISNEYGSRVAEENERITNDDRPEGIRLMDPLEAFEMIQSEHRLLKDELEAQNQLLRRRMSEMEDAERQKEDELAELKDKVDTLTLELNERKSQETELERQIQYFKECSEKADVLTAKLMEAEDVVKEQDALLKQMQRDGCSSVPPPTPALSTDGALAAELTKKDEQIKKMQGSLALMESALGSMHQERTKAQEEAQRFKDMNLELQEVLTAFQAQTEMDKAEWAAIRLDMEQQIEMLSGQVVVLERQLANTSMLSLDNAPTLDNVPPLDTVHTLQHRTRASPTRSPPASSWIECPRCLLPMATAGPHPCPAIIDGLD